MEWMLQVVDEIDDLACAGLQRCENVAMEIGHVAVAVAVGGLGAMAGALALGADLELTCGAAFCATLAAILKARHSA